MFLLLLGSLLFSLSVDSSDDDDENDDDRMVLDLRTKRMGLTGDNDSRILPAMGTKRMGVTVFGCVAWNAAVFLFGEELADL